MGWNISLVESIKSLKYKRIRIRRKNKTKTENNQEKIGHEQIGSIIDSYNSDFQDIKSSRNRISIQQIENTNAIDMDDNEHQHFLNEIKTDEKINVNLIIFDHILADFEIKLKYLNLKDVEGREYGNLFPPIKSRFIIIDSEGRKYSMVKAGYNQISGDLLSLINENKLKVGDILTIEYDRESRPINGYHIINLKVKK